MTEKIGGLARLIATLLAIIAGFVAIPGINIALVLVVLGLIAGIRYHAAGTDVLRLFLVVLVLPFAGAALGQIPAIGAQLNAAALNVALVAAAISATVIALRLFDNCRNDIAAWTGPSPAVAGAKPAELAA
ncbi:MAG: hypothetical protein ABIP41_05165 [Croceibacterium sp.]